MNSPRMKKPYLLLLVLCSLLMSSAPVAEPADRRLIKDYVFIPSGNAGDSLISEFYISSIEVTNGQYGEFLDELRESGAVEKLHEAMVDSTGWKRLLRYGEPFLNNYFRHPAYKDFPVVNVSKRGAELYCDWLTAKYNRTARQKARFALPTERQWEYAARGGNPKAIYPWPGNSLQYTRKGKMHGLNMCNYSVDSGFSPKTINDKQEYDFTAASRSYLPNTYEIYNMAGNVAEMIADRPYTKGGSYLSRADKVLIAAHEDADLTKGEAHIGFRPVMMMVNR